MGEDSGSFSGNGDNPDRQRGSAEGDGQNAFAVPKEVHFGILMFQRREAAS